MKKVSLVLFDFAINFWIWEALSFSSPTTLLIQIALYYFVCYALFKRTIAQYFFADSIIYKSILSLIFRESLKFLVLSAPFIYLLENNYFIYPTVVLLLTYLGNLLYFVFYKRNFWENLSHTHFEKRNKPKWYFSLMALMLILAIALIKIYQISHVKTNRFAEVELSPFSANVFPEYVDFLKDGKTQPAVDYVFSLFQKYNQVILCERLHPEETQWDFIYEFVKDPRFLKNNTVIFTEYGNPFYQSEVDTFLNTSFPSEKERLQATAKLMLSASGIYPIWSNTNFFNFLVKLNQLNDTLAPQEKHQLYFTSIPFNWDTLQAGGLEKVWKKNDSMASNLIIQKIEESKQANIKPKSLIIMNYRHAFRFPKDTTHESVANGIFNKYPNSTANVLINTITNWKGFLLFPIQNGYWDGAFEKLGNPKLGFDLKNTPFGKDNFDLYISNHRKRYSYQDVFTGFVFWEPLANHTISSGFPYMYDHKTEILRRAKKQGFKNLEMGISFESLLENVKKKPINRNRVDYFKVLFLLKNAIYIFLSLYSFIVLLLLFLRNKLPINNVNSG